MEGGKYWYCTRCEVREPVEGTESSSKPRSGGTPMPSIAEIESLPSGDVGARGLKAHDLSRFGVRVSYPGVQKGEEPSHLYFPIHRDGKRTGWKVKDLASHTYTIVGDGKEADLSGMELDGGRRLCIITEGYEDMVAAKVMLQMNGKDYRVVSLPNGAKSKITATSFEFLSSFESVIIATDMDEAGEEAASRLVELLPGGVCKRAILPVKDANDCLLEGLTSEFYSAIMSARTITADGVVLAADSYDRVLEDYRNSGNGGVPYPWACLNELLYGCRVGDIDTWTSGTGMGKTAIMREVAYNLHKIHGEKVGMMALEEPLTHTVLGQMSIAADMPLHLPEIRQAVSDEDLKRYHEEATGNDKLVCFEHFGSVQDETLISKLRYMVSGMGCKYIILDHISILVSEFAAEGDERTRIDTVMTKLKRLTQELGFNLQLVTHLRKSGGTPFEEGGVPSLNDLRGSASIAQLSNQVVALARNQQASEAAARCTTSLHVLKNRFAGRTGPAGHLIYDTETGRLRETDPPVEASALGGKGR